MLFHFKCRVQRILRFLLPYVDHAAAHANLLLTQPPRRNIQLDKRNESGGKSNNARKRECKFKSTSLFALNPS
jgi:hypothetical protein